MQKKLLKKLGLNEKELALYLKLLEFGGAAASTLAQSLGGNRTSTYSLLNSMIKRGFVEFYEKRGVKYFSATSPQLLIDGFFSEAQQLKSMLPELLALSNKHAQKPKITFYEGVEGIKRIGDILLEVPGSTRESFMGVDEDTIHPAIKDYYENEFIQKRIEKGITYRGIITGYIPMSHKHPSTEKGQLRELKIVNPATFPIRAHVDIFPNNKVAIYSYNKDEMMGVIIEHESFYTTMRTVFKLAWAGVDALK